MNSTTGKTKQLTESTHLLEDILEELAILKSKLQRGEFSRNSVLLSVLEEFPFILKSGLGNATPLISILFSFKEDEVTATAKRIRHIVLTEE